MIGNPLFRNFRITIPEHFGTTNKKRTPLSLPLIRKITDHLTLLSSKQKSAVIIYYALKLVCYDCVK